MIGKVLTGRQIKIERARLKHDAEPAQGFAGGAVHVETKNVNLALLYRVETRDQTEECDLTCHIESEEDAEACGPYIKGNIVQDLAPAVAMAHTRDSKSGRNQASFLAACGCRFRRGKSHCGAITTPQGKEPTGIDLTTLRHATSITETSFETPLVV